MRLACVIIYNCLSHFLTQVQYFLRHLPRLLYFSIISPDTVSPDATCCGACVSRVYIERSQNKTSRVGPGIRLLLVSFIMVSVLLTGCKTVSPGAPKKWDKDKRVQIYVDLGMSYLRSNQLRTAQIEFEKALKLSSRSDHAHHAMGLLYAKTGQTTKALKHLGQAIRLNSRNYIAINDYGSYLCQNKRVDRGLYHLNRIEKNLSNDARVMTYLTIGLCYYESGIYDNAKRYLRKSLETSPTLSRALYMLADIYYRENNGLKARAFIERLFSTGNISAKALLLGAQIESQLGDRKREVQYMSELRKRYPDSPLANYK